MSFILDALKKSEMERQRQSTPGLVDARMVSRRRGLPVWALVVAALLVINLGVLGVVLWKQHTPAQPARAQRSAPGVAMPGAATTNNGHFSPMDNAPVYAPEIPVSAEPPAATSNLAASGVATPGVATPGTRTPGTQTPDTAPRSAVPRLTDTPAAVATPSRSPARAGTRRPDPLLTDRADEDGSDEMLPTINEVNLTGPQALPEIHLDVHVWGSKAGDRFVFINGRKYHQGATLAEGPVIDKIRRDGVVLDWRGLRFLLPRQ